jgi:hypothetical protein
VGAKDLVKGEQLITAAGEPAFVSDLAVVGGRLPLFNLEVEQEHVYFVGEDGVLVHNGCPIINKHLAGNRHPDTGVLFDRDGFPVFDSEHDFDMPKNLRDKGSDDQQMKAATRHLIETLARDPDQREFFSAQQLAILTPAELE